VFHKRAGSRGFTLIELLVVIAIIAILAAILFPVFAQVRAKGLQTQCLSNLKQIAMATSMYVQDYEDTFPISSYASSQNGSPCFFGIDTALGPYTKNAAIWHCPVDPTAVDIRAGALSNFGLPLCAVGTSPGRDSGYVSYLVNQAIVTVGNPNPLFVYGGAYFGAPVVKLSQIDFSADTAVIYDASLTGLTAGCNFDSLVAPRHRGIANVTWADGHAKAVKTEPTQQTCPSNDGKQTLQEYDVADAGPYRGKTTLTGIPFKNPDGSWGLR